MKDSEMKRMVEISRAQIPCAVKMSDYIGQITGWVISPTPAYFDCGEGPSFEICAVDQNGYEGEAIFMAAGPASEWECYQVSMELFGYAFRSSLYSRIFG